MLRLLPEVVREGKYEKMIDACLLEYVTAACSPMKRPFRLMWFATDMACRSYLAVNNKYAITPVQSLVRNLGFDGSGVYCQTIVNEYGNTAGTYDYSTQPIDLSSDFELVEDIKHADEENRRRLNVFDYRSPAQMRRALRLLWLAKHLGVWAAKVYSLICFPFDILPKAIRKLYKRFIIR